MNLIELFDTIIDEETSDAKRNSCVNAMSARLATIEQSLGMFKADVFEDRGLVEVLNQRAWYKMMLEYLWKGEVST